MTKTYNIRTTHGDRRIIKTFKVTGKDEEECLEEAEKELDFFIENLELEPE